MDNFLVIFCRLLKSVLWAPLRKFDVRSGLWVYCCSIHFIFFQSNFKKHVLWTLAQPLLRPWLPLNKDFGISSALTKKRRSRLFREPSAKHTYERSILIADGHRARSPSHWLPTKVSYRNLSRRRWNDLPKENAHVTGGSWGEKSWIESERNPRRIASLGESEFHIRDRL